MTRYRPVYRHSAPLDLVESRKGSCGAPSNDSHITPFKGYTATNLDQLFISIVAQESHIRLCHQDRVEMYGHVPCEHSLEPHGLPEHGLCPLAATVTIPILGPQLHVAAALIVIILRKEEKYCQNSEYHHYIHVKLAWAWVERSIMLRANLAIAE